MDNGQGFSEEMLEILNDENKVLVMKNNVGIANVVKRLSLAYEKESSVVFSNSNGACVDIFIPIRRNQYLRNNLID